ncbi:MAG: amidohydrolase family protein [Xanthomonadales bacterium]|nr:amidohydrolase family protein [Xanthomonadales bacterium]
MVIHAGEVLFDTEKATRKAVSLVAENGTLISIEDGYFMPEDLGWSAETTLVVDLKSAFVLPGLIDFHVHLTSPVDPGGALRAVTENPADLAFTALTLGWKNLAAGFTTVVDLGTGRLDHEMAIYALRDAVAAGKVMGPRIIAAGSPISPTGASRTGHYLAAVEQAIPPQGECDGADHCRRVVLDQIARGADIINVYNSGSLNDEFITQQTFTAEEFEAITTTAHSMGKLVIADGHTAAGINAALRAGADIVDTAPWPDEESWKLLRQTGAAFVPHLFAFESAVGDEPNELDSGTMYWIPSPIKRRLLEIKSKPYSAERAYREGVTLVFGSDTGVIEHGDNAGEFAELTKIGLSNVEAIGTATGIAAKILGLDQIIGSLEPGKTMDLIAVRESPLEDIRALEEVSFVMKSGKIFRNEFANTSSH